MGFTKHGTGRVLKDEDQPQQKTAKAEGWTDEDQAALDHENEKADQ